MMTSDPRRLLRPLGFILVMSAASVAAENSPVVLNASGNRLKADVSYLADDARDGRGPGTAGIEAAADYIATTFKEIGLKPAAGAEGFFQQFQLPGPAKLGDNPTLSVAGSKDRNLKAEPKSDFTPLAIGSSGDLKDLPVVFVGYGITAKDDETKLDYDDYAGLDVKGKAVLLIRKTPQQANKDSKFSGRNLNRFGAFRHKITNAFSHGAAAVLIVNDAATVKGQKDVPLGFTIAGNEQNSKLPFVSISRAFADSLLDVAGAAKLAELEAEIDTDGKPHSKDLEGLKLSTTVEVKREQQTTKNVIGVLEGSGPLADETIVIGGHYDHLGRGGLMSGSLAFLSRDIHNGADDNASGTSMVLEMARRLARRTDPLPRRVVFMAFSGEERGLLGSQHYCDNPLYSLDKTVMMFNFDMVGRLNDEGELTIFGTGSSPTFGALAEALGTSAGFKIKQVAGISDGIGGSDHQSFYQKNIPVLFAFTGTHKDYHRPSDDTHLINFVGMSRIADLGEILLLDLIRRPERPSFTKPVPKEGKASADPGRAAVSVYFGSIPSYDDSDKGVKLTGVRDGSPAEKAGLKANDVIIKFGDKTIGTIYEYTEQLGNYKPGDVVDVVVKRGDAEVTLKVTLAPRPGG